MANFISSSQDIKNKNYTLTGVHLNCAYVATTDSMPNSSWPAHDMQTCGQFGIIPPGYWARVVCDREASKVILYMINRLPMVACEVHVHTVTHQYKPSGMYNVIISNAICQK